MKKRALADLVLIGAWLIAWTAPAAGAEGRRADFAPAARFALAGRPDDVLAAGAYALTTRGLVVVGEAGRLACQAPDGRRLWTQPSPTGATSFVQAAAGGTRLVAYHPLGEGRGIVRLLDAQGRVLWSASERDALALSDDGRYLYSLSSALAERPLRVLDARARRPLWQAPGAPFRFAVLDPDTGVHLSGGRVRLLEMRSGKVLAERDLRAPLADELAHVDWDLAVPASGSLLSVLGRASGGSLRAVVWTLDRALAPLWSETFDTGYPELVGVTEDGAGLAVRTTSALRFYDNASGKLLWEVERELLNNGAVVASGLVALSQAGFRSEVFALDRGALVERSAREALYREARPRPAALGASHAADLGGGLLAAERRQGSTAVTLLRSAR